jgi:hypothetical protein
MKGVRADEYIDAVTVTHLKRTGETSKSFRSQGSSFYSVAQHSSCRLHSNVILFVLVSCTSYRLSHKSVSIGGKNKAAGIHRT